MYFVHNDFLFRLYLSQLSILSGNFQHMCPDFKETIHGLESAFRSDAIQGCINMFKGGVPDFPSGIIH